MLDIWYLPWIASFSASNYWKLEEISNSSISSKINQIRKVFFKNALNTCYTKMRVGVLVLMESPMA